MKQYKSAKSRVLDQHPYAGVWRVTATRPPRLVGKLDIFDADAEKFKGTSARVIWRDMLEYIEGKKKPAEEPVKLGGG